jgi:hypothetical protein
MRAGGTKRPPRPLNAFQIGLLASLNTACAAQRVLKLCAPGSLRDAGRIPRYEQGNFGYDGGK